MDAAPTLERGECYMPFQPPDCSLTVGDSLGWIFVVFQVGWALGWSMMLFFYVVGVVGPGFRQSSFFLATVALLPLLEVIRAYNPAGLKKDEPGTSEFLRVFFWCACGWATFEVCFLLIAILGVSASATRWRMPPSPTLWQYATMGLPLSPRIQLVRLAAHLSMWVILFVSIRLRTVRERAILTFVLGTIVAFFMSMLLINIAITRRRLLKAKVLSPDRSRAISQSGQLLKLLVCYMILLLVAFPTVIIDAANQLHSKEGSAERLVLKERCDFGCVLRACLIDLLSFFAVVVVCYVFILTTTHHDHGAGGAGGVTRENTTMVGNTRNRGSSFATSPHVTHGVDQSLENSLASA
eukprot:TRINITY_DN3440_c0_g1_i2.p1 TRINITY_DN3440_c0_g1~~TRINITY_DN3440_c0_g1_i2.p1  ORF type:complete len:353 (-),score=77.89 TRINITY_DN3440_c0_g1_i2:4-1062(-)